MSPTKNSFPLLKAALYVRLSNEDRDKLRKDDDSESIINQQAMLINYCKDNQIEIYNIYNDEDYSGSDRERPAFNRMINDAKNHKFNLILCKTLSRFARDVELVEKYINGLFLVWGVRFISVVDNTDSNNRFNRKQRQITSLVDQWYLEDLSENVRATLATKRRQGLWVGAFAPYGYKKDPNDKNHLIVDEEAAEVVKYVFDLYLRGLGITSIARKLNSENIPNPATYKKAHNQPFECKHKNCSDMWHTYSISRMLSNKVYIGCVVQGMTEKVSYKLKGVRKKPKEEWDVVENTHEPIIDMDTWDKVQKIRDSKPKTTNSGEPNILATKVRCLRCGACMRIFYSRHIKYYRCNTQFLDKDRCSGTYVSESVLHRAIIAQIQQLYQKYVDEMYVADNLYVEHGYEDKLQILQVKLNSAEQSVERIDKRIKNLYLDKLDEIITKEEFLLMSKDCRIQKDALSENILLIKREMENISEQINNKRNKIDIIRQFKGITELDFMTVNTLIDHIEVGGSKCQRIINIHWNI